ncbi:S1C family serine protease [Rothia sp. CCM 9416]|uniref:S1C family serine protease n=1 Tax=Rothia sp. CCM 9416 TaxID=3402655 RepID=UPI003AE986F2
MSNNPWEQENLQSADDRTVPLNSEHIQAVGAQQAQPHNAQNPIQGQVDPSSGASYQQPAPARGAQPAHNHQGASTAGSYNYAHAVQGQPPSAQAYPQNYYAQVAPAKKHSTTALISAAAIAALIGGGVGGGVAATLGALGSASITRTSAGTTIVNNTDSVNAVTAAAAKAIPSVVTISANTRSEAGSGSGIILDDQGHILTNTHVVTLDGATSKANLEVQLSDGNVRAATVVGTDPTSDLAVIKISDTSGLNLTPASLGDSGALNVGDTTVAIGAPLGLSNTVTTGIVSNMVRTIEVASSAAKDSNSDSDSSDPFGGSPFQFEMPGQQRYSSSNTSSISLNVIQTDAAVNPGNSGGALVNSAGEVIGVNVAIASTDTSTTSSSGNIGVGFAIPINYAKRVANEIIESGSASHGMLGASVTTSPANKDASESFGDGALIKEVTSGGAAEKAGLEKGDVVTAVDGRTISEATELTAAVREAAAGQTVTLTVERKGSSQQVEVTLGQATS